jgi:DNA-binding Xre family transcriptional regulator
MLMRLRIPELTGDMTAYELSKRSGGRISMSTAYRLVEKEGRLHTFDAALLEALCDVLAVEPGDLLERNGPLAKRRGRG